MAELLIYLALFMAVFLAILYRGFPVKFKALIVSILFFVTGIAAIYIAGPCGQRGVGIIASVIICSLYVNFGTSIVFSLLGLAAGMACGYMNARGVISWPRWPDVSLNTWILQSIDIFIIGLMLSVATWALMRGIAKSFRALRASEELNKKALAEKETLLGELYHRTKNNMQVISSLIKLHSKELQSEQDAMVFRDVTSKISAMALVQQLLYESQSLSSIDARSYLTRLAELMVQSYSVSPERVSLELDVAEVPLLVDTAMPLALAISEIIGNSLKHAFPEERRGRISLSLRAQGDELVLRISDDGIGLRPDFSLEKHGHLGLKTLYTIIERQLRGSVQVDSTQGLAYALRVKARLHEERVTAGLKP
jgi:two-component sensor histidine kinase